MYEMNIKITELIPIANETQSDDYFSMQRIRKWKCIFLLQRTLTFRVHRPHVVPNVIIISTFK